jgi:hypothetical protein
VNQVPFRVCLSAAVATLLPLAAHAQADRYAPSVLQLAPTPRAATFGSTAVARDIEAIFGNPALLGVAPGTVAGVGRFDAATQLTIASSASLGPFNVGIGAQHLTASTALAGLPRDNWSYSLQLGGPVAVSSSVGAFGLSMLFRGNRVGAAVKYVEQRTGGLHDGVPSLDLGLTRDVSRYLVGITVQNIGAGIHFPNSSAQLPLRVSAGVSSYGWAVGPLDLNGSAGLSVLPDGMLRPAFGLEAAYVPMEGYNFAVRGGLRRPEFRAQRPLNLGASAALDRFALEYAWEDWDMGRTHRLALRVR